MSSTKDFSWNYKLLFISLEVVFVNLNNQIFFDDLISKKDDKFGFKNFFNLDLSLNN